MRWKLFSTWVVSHMAATWAKVWKEDAPKRILLLQVFVRGMFVHENEIVVCFIDLLSWEWRVLKKWTHKGTKTNYFLASFSVSSIRLLASRPFSTPALGTIVNSRCIVMLKSYENGLELFTWLLKRDAVQLNKQESQIHLRASIRNILAIRKLNKSIFPFYEFALTFPNWVAKFDSYVSNAWTVLELKAPLEI